MADNTIDIAITLSGDGEQKVQKFNVALKQLGDEGQKAGEKATHAWETFKGVFAAEVLVHAIEKVTEKLYEFAREAITEAIHKAIEQENAIATLNNALAASGTFTVELSRSLQEFGEKIQKTTEFTQEQALQSQALFISLNNLTEAGIKRATKAALDLAVGLQIDLHTATLQVSQAIEGTVGRNLKKLGLQLDEGASKTENLSKVTEAVARSFGGFAAARANTYAGALAILTHQYEESSKATGNAIITNQSLINVMQVATKILEEYQNSTKGNKAAISELVSNALIVLIETLEFVVKAARFATVGFLELERAVYGAGLVIYGTLDAVIPLQEQFGNVAREDAKSVVALGQRIEEFKNSRTGFDSVTEALEKLKTAAVAGFGKVNDTTLKTKNSTSALREDVEKLTEAQKALLQEGENLSKQAENKNPFTEYENRAKALLFAYENLKISGEQLNTALNAFAKEAQDKAVEANRKIEEENAKHVEVLLEQNEALKSDGFFKNQERIQANFDTLREIENNEKLSTKERIKIDRAYAENSKTIEKERTKAVGDALDQLATLQSAKTAEIAAVGKAAAIAKTTIDTYAGAQAAAGAVAGIPGIGPFLAAAVAAAYITAGLARVATIAGVPLATGITEVPAGYSNDTFPARLTSGERVVDVNTNQDLKTFLSGGGEVSQSIAELAAEIRQLKVQTVVNIGNRVLVDEVREGIRSGRSIDV
jgi:hypothetical protein